jgi:hypothetical protein
MRALPTLITVLAGCGGGSTPLTCAMLADPTNCWASAAAGAAACVPQVPGTLAADRRSCTWSDGSQVMFDTALPTDTTLLDHLSFDVTGPGCAWHFTDTFMNKLELTVGGKTETSELLPDRTFELACDNGTTYSTKFDTLFTCQSPARAPTDGFELTATSLSFTLSAVGVASPLFTCSQ